MSNEVKMNEVKVCPIITGEEELITMGISTCICIVLKGTCQDQPFLLMHHWSGIDEPTQSDEEIIDELIALYVNIIGINFHVMDASITMNVIGIIGGQRRVVEEGIVTLTGTEREIAAIQTHFIKKLISSGYLTAAYQYLINPFITKDDESITVAIAASGEISCDEEHSSPGYRP
jgi:hypothetical protein